MGSTKRVYEFGSFRLDAEERLLVRDGTPLPLTPKLFDTLLLLVENSSHLLSKDELMKKLWPDSFVEEANLTQNVSRLRKILEETPSQRFISTIAGQGYRFVADVREVSDDQNVGDALIIESHARESIVVEQEDERDGLAMLAAGDASRRTRRMFWLVAAAITVATVIWFGFPPKPPRLLAAVQLTNDGRSKDTASEGPFLATDGSRIYMVESDGTNTTLSEAPVSGGDVVPIPSPFLHPQITDLDRHRSELLVLDWQGRTDLNAPLWAFSALNGSYRRVGDLEVSNATWTADGGILFTRGQELWSAKGDGSEKRLLASLPGFPGDPRETPDGSAVRFVLGDPHTQTTSIWEASRDGKNAHPLLARWSGHPRECCGTWTADGRYYIFQSLRDGKWGIWAVRETSGVIWKARGPFRLTAGPMDYVAPATEPDGKKLYVVGLQSRSELLRFDPEKRRFAPFLSELPAGGVDFSSDGKWVTYVSGMYGQLWRSRADGTNRQQLTFPPKIATQPRWSPDGKQIAFLASMPGKTWKIYVMSAAGGPSTELLPESLNEFDPTWSPDGKKLAFGRIIWGLESAATKPAVYTVDLDTKEVAALPGSDGLYSPRWSHQGQYLAALSSDSKRLLLYNFATNAWTELWTGGVAFPRWSHDDKYIYFDTLGANGFVCRVEIQNRRTERIVALENLGSEWSGLTPDDLPLALRSTRTEEVYAFDLELP